MMIGAVTAIVHGTTLPLLMVVFGETTDAFSNEYITREIARDVANASINNVSINNVDCTELNMICNTSRNTTDCAFFVEDSLCATGDDLIDEINTLVIYYCALGVVAFVCGWLHVSLFQYACERQLQIIRKKFFHSVLRQEIGWFDVNSIGELNSRLNK